MCFSFIFVCQYFITCTCMVVCVCWKWFKVLSSSPYNTLWLFVHVKFYFINVIFCPSYPSLYKWTTTIWQQKDTLCVKHYTNLKAIMLVGIRFCLRTGISKIPPLPSIYPWYQDFCKHTRAKKKLDENFTFTNCYKPLLFYNTLVWDMLLWWCLTVM